MGLIKAAAGAAGGVLADQWKEYFYCDALPADVIAVQGEKQRIRDDVPAVGRNPGMPAEKFV